MLTLKSSRYTSSDAKALYDICFKALGEICKDQKQECDKCLKRHCCSDLNELLSHTKYLHRRLTRREESWKKQKAEG